MVRHVNKKGMSNISWEQCRCDWTAILHCIYIHISIWMQGSVLPLFLVCRFQVLSCVFPWTYIQYQTSRGLTSLYPITTAVLLVSPFSDIPQYHIKSVGYIPFIPVISIFPPLYPSITTIVAHVPIKSIAGHSPQVLWKWTFAAMSLTWRSGCGQFP